MRCLAQPVRSVDNRPALCRADVKAASYFVYIVSITDPCRDLDSIS
jgi:hypothetical protein